MHWVDYYNVMYARKGKPSMNKQLLDLIKEKFQARLQAKTGWGRNDIMVEYQSAVNDALIELMDQQSNQPK